MYQHFARFMIQKQIEKIDDLKNVTRHNLKFVEWRNDTNKILKNIFGENSLEFDRFAKIRFCPISSGMSEREDTREIYNNGLVQAKNVLMSFLGKEVGDIRPAVGKAGKIFRKMGEGSFIAFDRLGENVLLFETLISKEDLIRCIKQAPQDKREEINKILNEMIELFSEGTRNLTKIKKFRDELLKYKGILVLVPFIKVINLITNVISIG